MVAVACVQLSGCTCVNCPISRYGKHVKWIEIPAVWTTASCCFCCLLSFPSSVYHFSSVWLDAFFLMRFVSFWCYRLSNGIVKTFWWKLEFRGKTPICEITVRAGCTKSSSNIWNFWLVASFSSCLCEYIHTAVANLSSITFTNSCFHWFIWLARFKISRVATLERVTVRSQTWPSNLLAPSDWPTALVEPATRGWWVLM